MKVSIIGGGPGGYVAAIRAAQLGVATTLVEGERLVCIVSGGNIDAHRLATILEGRVPD